MTGDDLVHARPGGEAPPVRVSRPRRVDDHGRPVLATRVPRRGAMPHQNHLGAVVHHVGRGHLLGPHRTRIVTAHGLGVATIQHRETQGRIDPTVVVGVELSRRIQGDVGDEFGIHGEARRQHHATGLGDLAQAVQLGPRTLGVHVIGRDRRDAAPVVDARVEECAEIVAQIRRGLQVDLGRQHDAGRGDGPQELVGGARRLVLHAGARFGQEVLHDDFLHVAMTGVRRGDGFERRQPIGAGLAQPHQDSGGERNAQLAGVFQRRQTSRRVLVGGATVTGQIVAQRLDHHSLTGRHRAQRRQIVAAQRSGVGVGEQAGLVEHQPAHGGQVLDRGRVSVLAQPVARHLILLLGGLAQGEERLVATHTCTLLGDGQHFVGREVRTLQTRRRLGEGAVSATVAAQHGEWDEHLG